jgi:hypothetical protein
MLIAQQGHAQATEELFREIDHATVVAALDRAGAHGSSRLDLSGCILRALGSVGRGQGC